MLLERQERKTEREKKREREREKERERELEAKEAKGDSKAHAVNLHFDWQRHSVCWPTLASSAVLSLKVSEQAAAAAAVTAVAASRTS